ncbi:MAG: cupin domain-containing protein [candidate division NC10 bacterium]|nr:cupin domain-containing protein [candidate division NC10 bacterium]MDE2321001.1 cupin domain-containing protein [candidate division NC10 bacterium]
MLDQLIKRYDWYDHPEGLKFVETHRDEYRTSGHWLMLPGTFSAFHRVLNNEELWYIHYGKITLHTIDTRGRLRSLTLGPDVSAGESPVIAVPKNCWQAAEIGDGVPYAFGSVVCAPAFRFELFEIGNRQCLIEKFPRYGEVISRLTMP